MSRPIKTSQGSKSLPKNSGPQGSQSMPQSSPSMPQTSQSSPKGSHSMSRGGQSMPPDPQPMHNGPPPCGPQSMNEGYPMPYGGGFGGYSMPPQSGFPMGYGTPPPMSRGAFPMSPDRKSMHRGMYPMYGGPNSSSMSQADNKNRMKTFSKSQRDTLSREGGKAGTSHQRGAAVPETMNRMTMDYNGRFIDSRGRVVDYSHDRDSSEDHRDDRYVYKREMPREEQVMYDYVMPGYMYGDMMENPEFMFDMEGMPGRYLPYYGQYSDDDYNYGMMGNMMDGYMDGMGGYNADFPGMHFPESRRMDSAGRYGDSFDR